MTTTITIRTKSYADAVESGYLLAESKLAHAMLLAMSRASKHLGRVGHAQFWYEGKIVTDQWPSALAACSIEGGGYRLYFPQVVRPNAEPLNVIHWFTQDFPNDVRLFRFVESVDWSYPVTQTSVAIYPVELADVLHCMDWHAASESCRKAVWYVLASTVPDNDFWTVEGRGDSFEVVCKALEELGYDPELRTV
jgi:hypothetical protein